MTIEDRMFADSNRQWLEAIRFHASKTIQDYLEMAMYKQGKIESFSKLVETTFAFVNNAADSVNYDLKQVLTNRQPTVHFLSHELIAAMRMVVEKADCRKIVVLMLQEGKERVEALEVAGVKNLLPHLNSLSGSARRNLSKTWTQLLKCTRGLDDLSPEQVNDAMDLCTEVIDIVQNLDPRENGKRRLSAVVDILDEAFVGFDYILAGSAVLAAIESHS